MPGAKAPEPEYVAARRVLLDAYEALGTHRKAVVLVGAQAIYLHVGEGDLAVTPYTTDGDLAIDPRELDDEPELASTLQAAGFELTVRPGTWSMTGVACRTRTASTCCACFGSPRRCIWRAHWRSLPIAGDVTRQARAFLQEHFGDRDGIGAQMAVRASVGLEDAAAIAISCEALARRLLDAWK